MPPPKTYFIYCHKLTGAPLPSRKDGCLYLMTKRPTKLQCLSYGYQKDAQVVVRTATLVLDAAPDKPPVKPLNFT